MLIVYDVFTVEVRSMSDKGYLVVQQGRSKTKEPSVRPTKLLQEIFIDFCFFFIYKNGYHMENNVSFG